ncbi:MAG TPA: hypothetical protein DIU07_06900 [Rhodobacteraceae bacterium]|nr:hypothetical protein [Paracoccaceae bacterium]
MDLRLVGTVEVAISCPGAFRPSGRIATFPVAVCENVAPGATFATLDQLTPERDLAAARAALTATEPPNDFRIGRLVEARPAPASAPVMPAPRVATVEGDGSPQVWRGDGTDRIAQKQQEFDELDATRSVACAGPTLVYVDIGDSVMNAAPGSGSNAASGYASG